MMTTETKTTHTPGPWLAKYGDRITTADDTNGEQSIVHCYSRRGVDATANRDFIVRACNAFPDLLAACIEAEDAIKDQIELESIEDDSLHPLWPRLLQMREAIAKAAGN